MQRTICILALVILAPAIMYPQVPSSASSSDCPAITIESSSDTPWTGTPVTFTAKLRTANPTAKPEFNWTISAGTIVEGQGTHDITVSTDGLMFVTITATVHVSGISTACSDSASREIFVINCGLRSKFDEYGNLTFSDEKARLDNFAIALQNEPGFQGYIIAYAGRRARAREAQARADRAKKYLTNSRSIENLRLITIDGGHREELTVELHLLPYGAEPPTAAPTVSPDEVEIIKDTKQNGTKSGRNGKRARQ